MEPRNVDFGLVLVTEEIAPTLRADDVVSKFEKTVVASWKGDPGRDPWPRTLPDWRWWPH